MNTMPTRVKMIPYQWVKTLKNYIPYRAAHTYLAHIWEYLPGTVSQTARSLHRFDRNFVSYRLPILRHLAQRYTDFAGWGKAPQDRHKVQSVLDWASSKLLK